MHEQTSEITLPRVTTISDLLSPGLFQWTHEKVTDPLINWGTYPIEKARDPRLYDWYQYTHVVFDSDAELSGYYDVCKAILLTALDRSDRVLDRLFKIRIVNSLPGGLDRAHPHIDLVGPHQTGIFFPETSDGDTVIMQERSWLQTWDTPETFTPAHNLAARANTWHDFDGTHWRYTGRPDTADHRFCVIFNFVAKPKPTLPE